MAPQQSEPFGRRGRQPPEPERPSFSPPAPLFSSPPPQLQRDVDEGGEDDDSLMARFIGPDWPDYQFLWRLMRSNGALIPSFSVAAFSFSFAWLFYRRLYLAGLTAMAIQIEMTRHAPLNAFIGGLLLSLGVGLFGKALVLQKGMKIIRAAREEGGGRISALGGTRLAPALASVVLVIAIGAAELAETLAHRIETVPAFSENDLLALLKAF